MHIIKLFIVSFCPLKVGLVVSLHVMKMDLECRNTNTYTNLYIFDTCVSNKRIGHFVGLNIYE